MQVYNALNGEEMIEVILDKIRKRLENTGEFKHSLTFPWARLSYAVGLVVYPQQGMEDTEPKIKVTGQDQVAGDPKSVPSGEEKKIGVSGSAVMDIPDKERVESKLPIPTITPGPGGQLIDKPVLKIPMKGDKK